MAAAELRLEEPSASICGGSGKCAATAGANWDETSKLALVFVTAAGFGSSGTRGRVTSLGSGREGLVLPVDTKGIMRPECGDKGQMQLPT